MGANIPLPALAANPPQVVDPLAQIKNALAVRNIQQQGQTQQLQQQAIGQENQQRALDLQDQQVSRQAMVDAAGDPDKYLENLRKGGVSGKTYFGQQQLMLQAKTTALNLTSKQHEIADQNNDWLTGQLETLKKTPPEERQGQYQTTLMGARQRGIDISQYPAQIPTDDATLFPALDHYESGLKLGTQIRKEALQSSEEFKNAQQGKEAQAATSEKNATAAWYQQNPQAGAPGVPPTAVEMGSFLAQHPGKTPADFAPYQAAQTEKATLPFKEALAVSTKAAEQAISDGDPKAAAKLLIDGTVAPSQIISSRKPAFAQQAFSAAAQMQPGWNAQKADADYKVASSPQQVAFFGSAKSLTDKGGTLDQLAAAGKDIPQNQFPVFNTVSDAIKASTGSGPIAKYAAIALGVADDYAKVMGGGQGSDTSRTQALNIISAKQSPEQRAASLEGIRGAVGSQTNSRIGDNTVLRKMYGGSVPQAKEQTGPPPGATHTAMGSDKQLHYTNAQGQDLGVVPQ